MTATASVCKMTIEELCLIWRPAPHTERFVVGALGGDRRSTRFIYAGSDLETARAKGFAGYPGMEDVTREYGDEALRAFAARLPDVDRPDYPRFQEFWHLDPSNRDPVYLLAATGGLSATDMFEFIPRLAPVPGTCFATNLAALTFYEGSNQLWKVPLGSELELRPEPTNPHDRHAVQVLAEGVHVGYVKKVHSEDSCRAIQAGLWVRAHLDRVRGNGAIHEAIVIISY